MKADFGFCLTEKQIPKVESLAMYCSVTHIRLREAELSWLKALNSDHLSVESVKVWIGEVAEEMEKKHQCWMHSKAMNDERS